MRRTPPDGPGPGPGETLDLLVGDWWVFQLQRGHRFSTDDMMCGYRAAEAMPGARSLLDLGCGIGSVGLYTLGMLRDPDAHMVGVEAQDVSVELARRSVARNGLGERVTIVHGDLRDPSVLPEAERFELVTGSPPYITPGKGVMSPHPQRRACRFELRGSVFDYATAARRWMAPGGRFVFVMVAGDERTFAAPEQAGLVVRERFDVRFRAPNPPLITVLTCARVEDGPFGGAVHDELVIRQADGSPGEAYERFRRRYGFID